MPDGVGVALGGELLGARDDATRSRRFAERRGRAGLASRPCVGQRRLADAERLQRSCPRGRAGAARAASARPRPRRNARTASRCPPASATSAASCDRDRGSCASTAHLRPTDAPRRAPRRETPNWRRGWTVSRATARSSSHSRIVTWWGTWISSPSSRPSSPSSPWRSATTLWWWIVSRFSWRARTNASSASAPNSSTRHADHLAHAVLDEARAPVRLLDDLDLVAALHQLVDLRAHRAPRRSAAASRASIPRSQPSGQPM